MKSQVQTMVSSIQDNSMDTKSEYYKFGFEYFGPLLFGYTKWLMEQIINRRFKKVYFFSRDGYMIKKAFDAINTCNSIETKYVYFSRKSIRQALLWICPNYKSSLKYISIEKYISLGAILEYYGFSKEERMHLSSKRNLDLKEDFELHKLSENLDIKELYEDLKKEIDRKSKYQYDLLSLYLDQIGMDGDCAIIDIGWHGSMQYYLEEFIRLSKRNASLSGYYLGTHNKFPLTGSAQGYLYDELDLSLRKNVLCFFGGFEKLFQSCEGSTYGYSLKENYIEPVLTTYEYENDNKSLGCITDWQEGAMDCVFRLVKRNFSVKDNKEWAIPLIKFGMNPSSKGIKLFSFFYNTDGKKEYFVSQKSLFQYKPNEFIHALSNSTWKTGFMKSVFKFPLSYYQIYRVLRK